MRGTAGEAIEDLAERVERLMLSAKSLKPNLDWPAARVYHALGLPVRVFTPIFVVARMSGWTTHVIEQVGDNRLIRPLSLYSGPAPRDYRPLAEFGSLALGTTQGLTMRVVGTAIGAAVALVAFSISVIAVPILMRHDVDVLTAIGLSVSLVLRNPGPMLLWAWLIAILCAMGLATLFVGLVIVFPLVGHATWHAYRSVVVVVD